MNKTPALNRLDCSSVRRLLAALTVFSCVGCSDAPRPAEIDVNWSNTRGVSLPTVGYLKIPPRSFNVEEWLAEDLAKKMLTVRSTGKATGELSNKAAHAIATAIVTECADFDRHLIAGLAWVESGFRRSATLKRPGMPWMLGLLQLNERYVPGDVDPMNPVQAVKLGCKKLRYWRKACSHSHPYLAHWFAGYRANTRAETAARKVIERAKLLRNLR